MKHIFMAAGSAAALSATCLSATAQDTDREARTIDRVLDVVTVSATKKKDPENVQNVPVAVTAFSADTLEALQVRDIESLSYSSPNVSLDDVGTSKGVANF